MTHSDYRYVLEFYADSLNPVGQVPVEPDWRQALESAAFGAMRRGRLPALSAHPTGAIEPLWHARLGKPYVSSFRALVGPDAEELAADIPTAYLRSLAPPAIATLVQRGAVAEGTSLSYLVCAYARPSARKASMPAAISLEIEEIAAPLPISPASLRDFIGASVAWGDIDDADFPVFVPRRILDEAVALARAAGDVEGGGVLIGHLHRDTRSPEIFAAVTALVPAPHTVGEAARVTFTAETWAAVDAAVALRGGGEQRLGWSHNHPDFCRKCPPESRARCAASSAFFSADDQLLHRACFGKGHQIALLISDSARTGMTWSLFGWRDGVVQSRGFYILQDRLP